MVQCFYIFEKYSHLTLSNWLFPEMRSSASTIDVQISELKIETFFSIIYFPYIVLQLRILNLAKWASPFLSNFWKIFQVPFFILIKTKTSKVKYSLISGQALWIKRRRNIFLQTLSLQLMKSINLLLKLKQWVWIEGSVGVLVLMVVSECKRRLSKKDLLLERKLRCDYK